MKKVLVAGSSGFIGSHLVDKLQKEGNYVIGVDIEEPKYSKPDDFYLCDLRMDYPAIPADEVYCLAALMGGMGYIGDEEKYGYDIAVGSTQIITNILEYCRDYDVKKVLFSSSACVYNQRLQTKAVSLKESDAIPADPDLLYGWQKLYAEKMFQASGTNMNIRIARFHNIFGIWSSFDNGKEKAPAALSRKVAMCEDGGEIEVWGDGTAVRSFLHIDECLEGVERLMNSDFQKPLNIGSDQPIAINDLAQMIIGISGKKLTIKNVTGIVGVQSRNSDNTLIQEVLGWKPSQPLRTGIEKLYGWINQEING